MSDRTPLLLIGGGGHCRSCIDVIEADGVYKVQGVVEADGATADSKTPYPLIGFDSELPALIEQFPHCLITVGQIKSAKIRQTLFEKLQRLGAILPTIISPTAYVSSSAELGSGTIVMHQALVNAYVKVGANSIINSQALIEHDVIIGDHCHIATGAKVNGGVVLGNSCFIGSGAVLKQGIALADKVVIGANSTVLKDITEPGTYTGTIK
ncbi:acetyltransferase [Thiomicrorhabdus xiamenensis]|uniref:Acetyltransferase n=1 Tax=Thiomicrorhabdus xiamenensis TaxID=2739063 RepID=A0A7D4NPD2_9GAMM|nr:acetyltransferase [Thiomicrorhabdus xiamenensis]QKI89573.1 acetyltransferase [Thiomicrorhabdus xiamenensis]